MSLRIPRSDQEIIAVFSLAIASGCLSAMAPAFSDVFTSYGLALPTATKLILAGIPFYLLAFAASAPAFLVLIAERVGEDRGWAAVLRRESDLVLDRLLGARAARSKAPLMGGAVLGSALLLFFGVFSLFLPVHGGSASSRAPFSVASVGR